MSDDGLRSPDELHADYFAIVPEFLLGEKSDVVKLYAILDRKANKDSRCVWPGQAWLAERMQCSDRHIRRLLNRLEEVGALVEVKRRYNGSTLYRLLRTPADPTRNLGLGSPERPDPVVRSEAPDRTGESGLVGPGSPPNESHLSRAKKLARTLPADFTVSERMVEWAKEKVPAVDVVAETERFCDHHAAKGSKFVDWEAAWKTWMRRSVDFKPRTHSNGRAPSAVDVDLGRPFPKWG